MFLQGRSLLYSSHDLKVVLNGALMLRMDGDGTGIHCENTCALKMAVQ